MCTICLSRVRQENVKVTKAISAAFNRGISTRLSGQLLVPMSDKIMREVNDVKKLQMLVPVNGWQEQKKWADGRKEAVSDDFRITNLNQMILSPTLTCSVFQSKCSTFCHLDLPILRVLFNSRTVQAF